MVDTWQRLVTELKQPSERFWLLWRDHKNNLRKNGYRLIKADGKWYLSHLNGPSAIAPEFIKSHQKHKRRQT